MWIFTSICIKWLVGILYQIFILLVTDEDCYERQNGILCSSIYEPPHGKTNN